MIVSSEIKNKLTIELSNSKSIWIASAMISNSGWSFLQNNLSETTTQFYLIGIDLATDPKVFESILAHTKINARVYQTKFTFHPKVYLIHKKDNSFTAFIGSSNTTSWGLEKNVEMNYQIKDQEECKKILNWFNILYSDGFIITPKFLDAYKATFVRTAIKSKEIQKEASTIKNTLTKNIGQFFSKNHHEIFNSRFHYINSQDVKNIRNEVRLRFLKLHQIIYPQFSAYGLNDLHSQHNKREIVSRHFFNRYSGNYINAMWLHYGKSPLQLETYKSSDRSTNRPHSFINNVRIQVIIRERSIGIWLVLGRSKGSKKDREHFRLQMQEPQIQKNFFKAFKKLGNEYWINIDREILNADINTKEDLLDEIRRERLDEYFIIGTNIDWLDNRLSSDNLPTTVLEEFRKLYPLYEIMRHR